MANNLNIMTTAPIKSATPTARTTSQNSQPKYKSAARTSKRNFNSTLDAINAKLDELKQNIKGLQKETDTDTAQIEDAAEKIDSSEEMTKAQGKSDTPQEAEKAIRIQDSGVGDDSEVIAEEEIKPADNFLDKNDTAKDIPLEKYFFGMNSEALLISKSDQIPTVVEDVKEIPAVQNLQTLLPQSDNNAQSMLQMLGGKTWRVLENQSQEIQIPPVEVEPVQTPQPKVQSQPVEIEPVQTTQPKVQVQHVEVEPVQIQQPKIQAQPVEIEPVQVQQPKIQAQPVEIEPVQVQQPKIQAQPVEIEPVQIQQPKIQAQPVESEPVQVQQPKVQAQPIEVEPVQAQQPTIQAQPVESEPVQVQQPKIQAQPVESEPVQIQQPKVQVQLVEVEPVQTPQPTIQAQPVESEPVQVQQPKVQAQTVESEPVQIQQPKVQSQFVEVEPVQNQQPKIQAQPVEVEPVQTTQPTIQTQPVESEPVQTPQPKVHVQPVEIEPVQTPQPKVQVQFVESEPVQTPQPTIQTQPVEVEPVQTSQPTIQAQPVESEPVQTQQPKVQVQPVESEPVQIQSAQPVLQQKIDERPAVQNFSELLGVELQVEEAPTTAPVTPPQSTPQQFNQNSKQQDESNFQNQIFQPIIGKETQTQPISTGGEAVFATNLAATSDSPQVQQTIPTQAPEMPQSVPQDDFDVPAQIVKQARLIRAAENSEMVIKLNPEHLGELTLRVSVSSSGAVNASFHSDNAQVRTIIENSLVQLRQELNNAGLKVENVQVYAGLSDGGGLMNGQGGQAWQQNRRQSNRRIDFDSLERDVDATAPVNENSATEGVDYSV